MKKQLLIAAVAASMTSVAMADISITGGAKVNFVASDRDDSATLAASSNAINHDMDWTVKGTSGDTTVSTTFSSTAAGAFTTEDTYLSTKIGDVSIKTGTWDNGDNQMRASGRGTGKISVSTSFEGVKVTFDDSEEGNATTKLSGEFSGVNMSYKIGTITDDYTISGSVAGINLAYAALTTDTANADRSLFSVSTEINGVTLTYAQAEADSAATIDGDGYLGDFEANTLAYALNAGDDVKGFGAKMALSGNTVQVKRVNTESATANQDAEITKFVITRPLANGTTFEAIYTDTDADTLAEDLQVLDLELAVKF
jgi:hypothetical protein